MKKRLCMILLVLCMFPSLIACGDNAHEDTQPNNGYIGTAPSVTVPPTTVETPLDNSLLFEDYMDWLNSYAEAQKVPGVSKLTNKRIDGNPNLITYSCDYAGGLIHLNISTQKGTVTNIMVTVSPYTLVERGECSNLEDAEVTAHALAIVPIYGINKNWNYQWHVEQMTNAAEQGDSTTVKRTYTKDNWQFTVIMGSAMVSVMANDISF